MTASERIRLARMGREYLELCNEGERLGVSVSLDDPRSPRTVSGLRETIEARKGEGSFMRTRQSLAGQLQAALDAMVARGEIISWRSHYGEPRAAYTIFEQDDYGPFGVDVVFDFTPGEAMDYVNAHGYDVQFGKR